MCAHYFLSLNKYRVSQSKMKEIERLKPHQQSILSFSYKYIVLVPDIFLSPEKSLHNIEVAYRCKHLYYNLLSNLYIKLDSFPLLLLQSYQRQSCIICCHHHYSTVFASESWYKTCTTHTIPKVLQAQRKR